jgi:hypothetical protein
MVIDDDQIALGRAFFHARDKALEMLWAIATQALLGVRGDLLPQRQVVRHVLDFSPIAGLRFGRPVRDRPEPASITGLEAGLGLL